MKLINYFKRRVFPDLFERGIIVDQRQKTRFSLARYFRQRKH